MKKFTLTVALFGLLMFSFVIPVGASSTMWSQTYGGADWDSAEAVIQTSDGGYALAGRTKSFGSGGYKFWLVKTDSLGNVEWNKTYGNGSAYSIVQTSDGGYVIGGTKLVKTDSGGNVEWEKTYGSGIMSMVQTSDGGYALAGGEFCLTKTDALGNMQWERNYGGPEREAAASVIQTSDGGYALVGTTRPGAGEGDFLLVKTDSAGSMEWSKTYGSQDKDEGHAVVQTSDGGYALAGLMWNRSGGDAGLIKTDSVGNIQWKRNYNGGSAWAMALTSDGCYIIACSKLVKTDSEGNIQWNQPYGSAHSVIQTSDGGYAMAGTSIVIIDDAPAGSYAWLIKTDPEGNIPEFPSWIILPLFLMVTLFVIYFKKKMFYQHP
jgi:hypothetical protein